MTWSQSICCALLLYHTRAQSIHYGHGEKFSTENEMANKVMHCTHLLVNSDWNSSNWLFSAKLGGLEALPQSKKALRLSVQPALAGFPELRQGFIPPNTTSKQAY